MDKPHHEGPAFLIARAPQPGKFKGRRIRNPSMHLGSYVVSDRPRVHPMSPMCVDASRRATQTKFRVMRYSIIIFITLMIIITGDILLYTVSYDDS